MELIFDPETQQVSIDKSKFSIKMKTAFAEGYFLRKRRRDLRRAAAKIGGVFHFLVKDEPHPEEADESVEPVAVETEKAAEARKTHEKLAEMDERIGRDARYALMKDLRVQHLPEYLYLQPPLYRGGIAPSPRGLPDYFCGQPRRISG